MEGMQPHRMPPTGLTNRVPARRLLAGLALLCALALTACGGTDARWQPPGSKPPAAAGDTVAATVTAPADGATNVPAATEITFTAEHATGTKVAVSNAATGATVDGAMRDDGSSWVPQQALKYGTKYTVKVTATGKDGKTADATSNFTTMTEPSATSHMISNLGDNLVYGIGAPIVLTFTKPIPDAGRAAVQKRLWVQSTPTQEGAWSWFSSTEVHYRPKDYWQAGTKIVLRALFRGVPLGNGSYGDDDLTVDASIVDKALRIDVDDKTKTLTVTQDGQVVKTMPASLGKASTPSSSGSMVIMTRATSEVFDSATTGIMPGNPDYYKETINWPLRLTWGGQYIHSAPWSVGQQGRDDVSHGCTNIAPDNAAWLYNQVHIGDPVTVKNTGATLKWGDGWTDWNVSFDEYVKGSAIPYAPKTAAAPSASASGN
jgi:lipoprotein-anchoring transpeptidase ErfK/SrfK